MTQGSHNDVDSAWTKTPECEEKMKDSSINEAKGSSEGNRDMLEYCTSTLHNMTLDLRDISGLSRTWGDHLILKLEGLECLTAILPGDKGQASGQGEPVKDIAKKRATQNKIQVAAFTCNLIMEEQKRRDSFQKVPRVH